MRDPRPREPKPIFWLSGYLTMSLAGLVEKMRYRATSFELFVTLCAPLAPRGKETRSPRCSLRSPSGVRSVGSPERTSNASSVLWCQWYGAFALSGGRTYSVTPSSSNPTRFPTTVPPTVYPGCCSSRSASSSSVKMLCCIEASLSRYTSRMIVAGPRRSQAQALATSRRGRRREQRRTRRRRSRR